MSLDSTSAHYRTPEFNDALEVFPPHVQQVLTLSAELCAVPGITVPTGKVDFANVIRTHEIAREFAEQAGLQVIEMPADPTNGNPYPYLMVTFQENDLDDPNFEEAVALIGHTDVVPPTTRPPEGEDQFAPYLKNGDLYARGAADMKTVVATKLVWMAERQKQTGPKPPFILMISSCEENGSDQPNHTGAALDWLETEKGIKIRFAVVGERTGELEWMSPETTPVGPICKENRSWRWMEWETNHTNEPQEKREDLRKIAEIIKEGRDTIQQLNGNIRAERANQQPGLKSGFVNPYVLIGPDNEINTDTQKWISVVRGKGASKHSATVSSATPTLIEDFETFVRSAEQTFGPNNIYLADVVIGEQGNFNSTDGSGRMNLAINSDTETINQWLESQSTTLAQTNLTATTLETLPSKIYQGPSVMSMDIRELTEHKIAVELWLQAIRRTLNNSGTFRDILDRPSWTCPSDHPDLILLESAYEDIVGAPSPNLVKLHGNDGGELARKDQERSIAYKTSGLGNAVVFGQVGRNPHGKGEFHRGSSIAPYWEILDRWADSYNA